MRSLDIGKVLHMKFSEATGVVVRDSTGNENHGVLTPGAGGWTTMRPGKGAAIDFDGADTVVNAGSDASLDNIWDGGGTFSIWVNPRSDGESDAGRILGKGLQGWVCYCRAESGGFLGIQFYVDFDGGDGSWRSPIVIPINEDTNIIVTYDSDSVGNVPTIYINGVPISLITVSSPIGTRLTDAGSSFMIGDRASGAVGFDGKQDEPILYDRILTPQKVRALYAEGLTNLEDGKVLDMEFKEGSGLVTRDQSGEGNDGTLGVGAQAPTWINEGGLSFDGGDKVTTAQITLSRTSSSMAFKFQLDSLGVDSAFCGRIANNDKSFLRFEATGDKIVGRVFDPSQEYFNTTEFKVTDLLEHIIVVVFKSNGFIDGYLDGVFKTTFDGSSFDQPTYITGIGQKGADTWMNGDIFKTRFYNRPLSPREIRELTEQWMNT